jgi:hypothetical protein
MIKPVPIYKYEMWKGKRLVGYFHTTSTIQGKFFMVPLFSVLKEPYNCRWTAVKVRVSYRCIHEGGPDWVFRTVLDVSRNTPNQIKKLKERGKL